LRLEILGPLRVLDGDGEISLGGAQQRAVLAILAVHRGEAVSMDWLVDLLWDERPPESAAKTVQVYVSRLRKVLGESAVLTGPAGYALGPAIEEIDADRFAALADSGAHALEAGDAAQAADQLREALALWRGPALADFAYAGFAQAEVERLQGLRLAALEERIDADLALGREVALVPELEALVREQPTRERLRGQLMLALYRSGRQADALTSYREGRAALREELGLEPGPALRELEQAILAQDPALGAPRARRPVAVARAGVAVGRSSRWVASCC
jgi:DNA-binding SARP family transcriptional activator